MPRGTYIRVSAALHKRMKVEAATRDTTMGALVETAIAAFIHTNEGETLIPDNGSISTAPRGISEPAAGEPSEWAELAAVAAQNPGATARAVYRALRFQVEALAALAKGELALDVELPDRFDQHGAIARPVQDPLSPLCASAGHSGTKRAGACDHGRDAGAEASGAPARRKSRAG